MKRADLKAYIRNQEWINDAIERYKSQMELVESISSPRLDGMPRARNSSNDFIEELLDSYNEMLKILNKEQQKQNEVMRQLNTMKDEPKPYRSILTHLYIDGYSLEKTADKIHYSYQKTSTMHGAALNEFDKLDEVVKKG